MLVVPVLTLIWTWALCQVPLWDGKSEAAGLSDGCFYAFRLPSGLPPFFLFPCCTPISFPVFEIDLTTRARRGILYKETSLLTN